MLLIFEIAMFVGGLYSMFSGRAAVSWKSQNSAGHRWHRYPGVGQRSLLYGELYVFQGIIKDV